MTSPIEEALFDFSEMIAEFPGQIRIRSSFYLNLKKSLGCLLDKREDELGEYVVLNTPRGMLKVRE